MPIQSICSGCGQTLRVADEHMGKLAKCPSCGTVYRVGEGEIGSQPATGSPVPAPTSDPYAPTSYDAPTTEFQAVPPAASPLEPVYGNSAAADKTYFAQTPDGKVYGPTDYATLVKWSTEGRLNMQCMVREADSSSWVALSSILGQGSANPYAVQYSSNAATVNQSVPFQSDRSAIVLTLGIISWFLCCFGPICAIIAIILGYLDLYSPNAANMSPNAKTMTQVGFYLAIANVVVSVLFFIFSFLTSL
jgi:uncharacterized membrane protein